MVVTTADNIQLGQTLTYDITGFGADAGDKLGLVSGPVSATNFGLPEPDSALLPTLDWQGPVSTPNPVSSPFDNFTYAVITPEESLVYHYNAVHELTDIASALPHANAYAETFQYDPAGALIARTIVNPSSKSRMPIPGELGNLPTERYTYERDPLGRVRTGSRELANLNGGFDSEVLAAFTYYADTYKVRNRGLRQAANEPFSFSQPVYAGASELADVSLPPDPSTAAVLRTEYLTGGAMGTDEILAQYTAADLTAPQGGYSPATHPIQDVNRRVFMTLKSVVGQPTAVAERAVYSAFGERNILERSTTDTFSNTWTPHGFGPQLTGGPRPNGLSNPLSQEGQVHGFQGRRHEDLPGIMDFRNRLYDPRLGRFLERDPVSDPNNPNPYAFEANNPINNLDPMGTAVLIDDLGWFVNYNIKYTKLGSKFLVYSAELKPSEQRQSLGFSANEEHVQKLMNYVNNNSGVWSVKYRQLNLDDSPDAEEISTPNWFQENKKLLPQALIEGMGGQIEVKKTIELVQANDAADAQSAHVDNLDNTRELSIYRDAMKEGTANPLHYLGLGVYAFRDTVTLGGTQSFDVLQGMLDRNKITLAQAKSIQRRSGIRTTAGAFLLLAPGTSTFGSIVPKYTVGTTTPAVSLASASSTVTRTSTSAAEEIVVQNAQKVTLYRGTNNALELSIYKESGVVLSDAGKIAYAEGRFAGRSIEESLNLATQASKTADAAQMGVWYNSRNMYVQAHGTFGQELSVFGDRSMISWTTDPRVARQFAGEGGIVIKVEVDVVDSVAQTLPGATESEHLIIHSVVAP